MRTLQGKWEWKKLKKFKESKDDTHQRYSANCGVDLQTIKGSSVPANGQDIHGDHISE